MDNRQIEFLKFLERESDMLQFEMGEIDGDTYQKRKEMREEPSGTVDWRYEKRGCFYD